MTYVQYQYKSCVIPAQELCIISFTGTSERVCLIVGTVSACQKAHEDVAQIIYDKPDPQPKPSGDGDGKINYQRHHQVLELHIILRLILLNNYIRLACLLFKN